MSSCMNGSALINSPKIKHNKLFKLGYFLNSYPHTRSSHLYKACTCIKIRKTNSAVDHSECILRFASFNLRPRCPYLIFFLSLSCSRVACASLIQAQAPVHGGDRETCSPTSPARQQRSVRGAPAAVQSLFLDGAPVCTFFLSGF